jgi:CHAT domain-containing protein
MTNTGRACLFAAVCLLIWGCKAPLDPQSVHDQIAAKITHGDFNAALSQVNDASARFGSRSPQWEWSFRVQKAQILISRSAWRDALAILNGPLPPSLASTELAVLKSLFEGSAHMYLQEFDASQSKLSEAIDLANSSHPRLLCQVLSAKAALAGSKGDYAEAERNYDQALKLAREHGRSDQEVAARAGQAWVATHLRHLDQAVEEGASALELSQSLGMQSYSATILGNLAWNYSELGDPEAAHDKFKQGAEAAERIGMSGYSAYWFTGVADAYMALRQYDQAEDLALKTLKQARDLKNEQTATICLNELSDIMLRTDRVSEADKFNQDALKNLEADDDKRHILDAYTMAGRIAAAKGDFTAAEKMFQRVLSDQDVGPELTWVSNAGLARVRDGQANFPEAERLFLKAIDTIEQARRSIGHEEFRLSFLSSGIVVYGYYIDFLIRRGRPTDALHEADLSRAQTLEEGLGSNARSAKSSSLSVPPQQIAQRLKATLLFYWLGESHSYLWAITPAEIFCFTLPPAKEIDPLVQSYEAALLDTRDPLNAANADGRKLYTLLIQPAQKQLATNSHVILLPDASLYGLNFETLIVTTPQPHYWIEDVTLATGSSLSLLASASQRVVPKGKSLFLMGDTVPPNDHFSKLTHAADEMKNVEKYFPELSREVLSGSEATPEAYLEGKPEHYSYLHFVTHGTASRINPLESSVILSKEKGEDSYKLYARDIVRHRLTAYLVTISACNTSTGRTFSGEGLVGLSWAFMRAGAHSVIGALWEVSDTSTPQLMDSLYDGLSRGQDPASALRTAKLSLLHSDSFFKKPRYWAPFQLYTGS